MIAIAFYKPFDVLSHFTGDPGQATLANYISIPNVYAAGRLDKDSEGLLLLTDSGQLSAQVTSPRYKLPKTYLCQVEGIVSESDLIPLREGILLGKFLTKPAEATLVAEPDLPARPVPVRDYHPTSWIKIVLREGKNRQVRRMTAKIGFPTLRLVRTAIGPVTITNLDPGSWRFLTKSETETLLSAHRDRHK
jgi:23S rRNA pseudouridine2457 synthase